jgi:hypothetical protein
MLGLACGNSSSERSPHSSPKRSRSGSAQTPELIARRPASASRFLPHRGGGWSAITTGILAHFDQWRRGPSWRCQPGPFARCHRQNFRANPARGKAERAEYRNLLRDCRELLARTTGETSGRIVLDRYLGTARPGAARSSSTRSVGRREAEHQKIGIASNSTIGAVSPRESHPRQVRRP